MELESEEIRRVLQWLQKLENLSPELLQSQDRRLADRLRLSYGRETPAVLNHKISTDLQVGDYVFASRWADCSPGDPWYIGHIAQIDWASAEQAVPYPGYVLLKELPQRRWPHAMRITPEQGARIMAEFPGLESDQRDFAVIARIFGVAPAMPDQPNQEPQ